MIQIIKTNLEEESIVSDEEDDDEDLEFELGTSNMTLVCNFITDLLLKIKQDKKFVDNKFSQSIVDKDIKTKNEENKDRNLYVMEILDEGQKLRKELTQAGITRYADLSKDFSETLIKEDNDNALREEYNYMEAHLMKIHSKVIKKILIEKEG